MPIDWHGCGGGLECATLAVPVSYQDPGGPTLDLALVRNPADVPSQRIGTLLMNPGGPGASGVRRVARGFQVSPEVGDRFDIVGFDPRGVGQSTPITCGDAVPAFRAADLAPDTPGGGGRPRRPRPRPSPTSARPPRAIGSATSAASTSPTTSR